MKKLTLLLFILLNTACAFDGLSKRTHLADEIASANNMQKSLIKTSGFSIMSYQKITKPEDALNIYIEGDGFAWASAGRLSTNPTTRNPVALKLASLDKSANVVYLARPCQYVNLTEETLCQNKYWHGSQYSKLVVDSINQAIDKVNSLSRLRGRGREGAILVKPSINLIGYSGGGAIVAILGAMRSDVKSIRTVAGNLDHVAFNKYHAVDMLDDSLNAVDFAIKLQDIPQLHLSGSEDKIVPPFIAESFAEKVGSKNGCVEVKTLKNVSHEQGWEIYWQELISKPLICATKDL